MQNVWQLSVLYLWNVLWDSYILRNYKLIWLRCVFKWAGFIYLVMLKTSYFMVPIPRKWKWKEQSGAGFRCPEANSSLQGRLRNFNTIENFRKVDKKHFIAEAGMEILEDIESGAIWSNPCLLFRRKLISFADLNKYRYWYWMAFPTLSLNPPVNILLFF